LIFFSSIIFYNFWTGFGRVSVGINGIIGTGGNNGKTESQKLPVFFPLFPLIP